MSVTSFAHPGPKGPHDARFSQGSPHADEVKNVGGGEHGEDGAPLDLRVLPIASKLVDTEVIPPVPPHLADAESGINGELVELAPRDFHLYCEVRRPVLEIWPSPNFAPDHGLL